jgi:hypothetical protein
MFHLWDKYTRDDSFVKFVFDHVRNIGLIALVLGASAWKQKHIESGWVAVWDHTVSALLLLTGLGLLYLNHDNLLHKLRSLNASRWIKVIIVFLYAVIFGELLKFLQSRP